MRALSYTSSCLSSAFIFIKTSARLEPLVANCRRQQMWVSQRAESTSQIQFKIFLVATFKKEKQKDEINLNNVSDLAQCFLNILISTCNQYTIINEIFYLLLLLWIFKIWCVFYTYCTLQIRPATFHRTHQPHVGWPLCWISEGWHSLLLHSPDEVFPQLMYVFVVTRGNGDKPLHVIWVLRSFPKFWTLIPRAALGKNRFCD